MNVKLRIGAHFSIRQGFIGAAKQAIAQEAEVYQYFPKNPRSLSIKSVDERDAVACRNLCHQQDLISVAHTPYPTNLAVSKELNPELYEKTVSSLHNDLVIADACGSIGVVVHFGHSKDGNPLQIYKNIIQCINDVLDGWRGSAKLLIENQAGDHGDLGTTLEEMVQIRKLAESPERIGFCLDTCHAFAAGVWKGTEDQAFLEKASELGYLDHLSVIHLNDSKYPSGSRKDRHARIGRGHIGDSGFRQLLSQPRVCRIPMIMETESGNDGTYLEDMQLARLWSGTTLQ